MSWHTRLRWTALLLAVVCLATAASARAGPYEIPASWSDEAGRLNPAGVDFTLDAIEFVPRLGVVAYGDHLLLRVEHGEPFVTLGLVPTTIDSAPASYLSSALLPDGVRLMTRTSVRSDGSSRIRETRVVHFDADVGREEPYAFPVSREGSAWTIVRLFADLDGRIFAYAGRGRPMTVPFSFDDVSPALEQRFYRLAASGGWEELPPLDPTVVSATDACVVDRSLIVVGSRIEKDAAGKVTVRRAAAAELIDGHWTVTEAPSSSSSPAPAASSMEGLRCGRARDAVYALVVTAAAGETIGRTYLAGATSLYRLDGTNWQRITLPLRDTTGTADSARVTAFTLDRSSSPWLAYGDVDQRSASLHHYKDGRWTAATLPRIPGVAFYSLSGIAFDDDGNGWAIANRDGNSTVPESHGILLGYDGQHEQLEHDEHQEKEWRLRGWRWNPLRQRAFGLFGNLR